MTTNRSAGPAVRVAVHFAALVLLMVCPPGFAAAPAPAPKPPLDVPLRMPADIVYGHGISPDSAVVFSHESHFDYADRSCLACHPRYWPMLHKVRRESHANMDSGRSCGLCHDDQHAFSTRDKRSCGSCHAGRSSQQVVKGDSSGTAAFHGPKAIVFPPGKDSPGRVTFRHETHTKGMKCASCHPQLFARKASAPRPDGAMHEASACGACHDGHKSFSVENDDKCDKCHKEGGGQ